MWLLSFWNGTAFSDLTSMGKGTLIVELGYPQVE